MNRMRDHFSRFRVSKRKLCVALLIFSAVVVLSSGCRRKQQGDSGNLLNLENLENEPKDYVRSVVLEPDLTDSKKYIDLTLLLQDGGLSQAMSVDQLSASKSEYSSLAGLAAASASGGSPENKRMRLDTIRINRPLPPSVLKSAGSLFGLQLSLTSKSVIKVFRWFDSEIEEKGTPAFALTDLPVNSDGLRRLRTGDLVVLPIEGQLLTAVDGSFIRNSFTAGRVFDSLLGSSLTGEAQNGIRANLLVSGRFELHIMKVAQNQVRVRFFQLNERSLGTSAGLNAFFSAQMTLLPLSRLQQVGEIKKSANLRVTRGGKLNLPAPLSRLSESSVLNGGAQQPAAGGESFEKEIQKRPDGLLEFSANINVTPEYIQQQAISRMDSVLSRVNPQLSVRIRKTADSLKAYSDQEIRFDAGIKWNEARRGLQQFYADYVFDLRDEQALEAYLQAVSGGAELLSSRVDLAKFIESGKPLHNLVLAERLARAQASKANPSVSRLLNVNSRSEISESRFDINMGRQLSFSLSEAWQREKYQLIRPDLSGVFSGFLTRWSFRQGTQFGLVNERRERNSGFMSDAMSQSGEQSVYWYSQELDSRTIGQTHLRNFFVQAHNILGPVAVSLGLDKLYGGEAEGRFRGRIVVGFGPRLLEKFFAQNLHNENMIWRSAAAVSESFDNTFGLPFLVIPAGMPSGLAGSSDEAACQKIATNWGSFYCHYLAEQFIPRWRTARNDRSAEARSLFFESFFSAGFGANKIGSDILARIILQWAVESQGRLTPEDVVVVLEGRHAGSSSLSFNPSISYGNSQLVELLGHTLPAW
jgi:hypothetical protein